MARFNFLSGLSRLPGRVGERASDLALGFVMLVIIALAGLPILGDRYARPLDRELRNVVEPGRGLLTEIHVALAIEGSVLRDYVATRQPEFLTRYREAYAQEAAAYAALSPLTDRLGSQVQDRLSELRKLEQRWHAAVDEDLGRFERGTLPRRMFPVREDLYEELLLAAAALDESLTRAAERRRASIDAAERIRKRIAVVLGIIAFPSALAAAWLGHRVRVFAREAEKRRTELELATESRARLMRGVSHDLKNPLGAIDGHAALLEEGIKGALTPDQKASITGIRRSVRSLLALIRDLLDLSMAEAGQLSMKPSIVHVAEVVRDAVEEHRASAEGAGLAVRIEIGDGLLTTRTDPDRVRQILGNLLSNATKYTPSGGEIVVRAEERTSNGRLLAGRWTAIDVTDTGPGIPTAKLEEIFKEFSRLQTGGKPGAGLGLTIARRISQLLGGDITVASEVGKGSTFTLWLPIDGRSDGESP
jgi:signal transduction histidine kinase